MAMSLTSPAFADGQRMLSRYTCEGDDVSPPLRWSGVPEGAKSLALICHDPDAPGGEWVHWLLYNLPPSTSELPEGLSRAETLPSGARQGRNGFGRTGYGGPCPPKGSVHRYFFTLYALDKAPSLRPGATKEDLLREMKGHVLAEARLMGTYKR